MVNAPTLHGSLWSKDLAGVACPAFLADAHSRGLRVPVQGRFHSDQPASNDLFRASSLPNRLVKQNACGNADVEAFDFAQHGNAHKLVTQATSESTQA